MTVIDLSWPIHPGMEVWPGDPLVLFEPACELESHGWRVTRVSLGTHTGTHVDAPSHLLPDGAPLDGLALDRFVGMGTVVKDPQGPWPERDVLLFDKLPLEGGVLRRVLDAKPKLVGFTKTNDPSVEALKALQRGDLREGRARDRLPDSFLFCAFPLKLQGLDGSPVRAVALLLP